MERAYLQIPFFETCLHSIVRMLLRKDRFFLQQLKLQVNLRKDENESGPRSDKNQTRNQTIPNLRLFNLHTSTLNPRKHVRVNRRLDSIRFLLLYNETTELDLKSNFTNTILSLKLQSSLCVLPRSPSFRGRPLTREVPRVVTCSTHRAQ